MNNLDLFEHSLAHPEPYVEDHYEKEKVIITSDPLQENAVMRANREILNHITGYEIARKA
jgi:hypothetical protein